MARTDTLTNFLTDVAESIRTKEGTSEQISASEFDTRIANLPSGGNIPEKGVIINAYNSYGDPTDVSVVGLTNIPDGYFYQLFADNEYKGMFRYVTNFTLCDEITSIGTEAFYSCTNMILTELPSSLKTIGEGAFRLCHNLKITKIPDKVTTIENAAFAGCPGLESIELPSSIKTLEANIFKSCSSLSTITILTNTLTIPVEDSWDSPFYSCNGLKALVLPNLTSVPSISVDIFENTSIESGTGFIYVPDNLIDSFKSASNWKTHTNQIKGISELPTE